MSPTQLTLKKLRKEGWLCAIVEKYNSFIKIRQDLFGFIDIVALRRGETMGVQTTTAAHLQARAKKILEHQNLEFVKAVGWKICVHGWSKKGARGKRKIWEVNELFL